VPDRCLVDECVRALESTEDRSSAAGSQERRDDQDPVRPERRCITGNRSHRIAEVIQALVEDDDVVGAADDELLGVGAYK
jgi:hypothetical protein